MAAPAPASSSSGRSGQSGGVSVGRYKRLDHIGKGSFATVYKAVHPEDGTLLAIKTVQHAQLKGKLKANLFSEIEIMRKITHPHIVALVDILESTNHIHLVMEFCQLGDLATFVKKRDKLAGHQVTADMLRRYPNPPGAGFNEVIVRHFAKQLACALEFLRSKNLVHRDLKPQNLLLNPPFTWIQQESPENRPFAVSKTSLVPAAGLESLPFLKIADFGFARHLPTTTMAETLCGSPLYMAPEILRYEKYDAKADLWSVGTVLYELMIGKPPFRAANHVELLRRIERTMDKIKFGDDVKISDDMKTVIRGLLKKTPTERMSWESFFQSGVITKEIPNLDSSDLPKPLPSVSEQPISSPQEPVASSTASENRPVAPRRGSQRNSEDRTSLDQPRFSTPPESNSTIDRRPSFQSNRPSLQDRTTAPSAIPGVRNDRLPPAAVERKKSIQPPSPGPSTPKESSERERATQQRQVTERAAREARERAAQDVAFERDYVMVEKRAVEVNAFADELAASPAVQAGARNSPSSPTALARRATTQAVPSTTNKTNQPAQTNRNMQIALHPEAAHQRRASYDRRYAPSRTSAQSALAAALNMVNLRFVNNPFAPALGKQPSPPQGYGPFPAFPSQPAPPLLLSEGPKDRPVDEDHRVLNSMEDSATRSDVVYGFAEVKYKQLVPASPSNEGALGGREDPSTEDDDGLTPDAVVGISEEALVLYLKALAILTNTINLAGNWWSQKARSRDASTNEASPVSNSPKSAPEASSTSKPSGLPAVGARINGVVQWSRNRFNECLEKSEFVSRKMLDAQRKVQSHYSSSSASPSKHTEDGDFKGNGVTAEKLMYERALDMSRAAAVNELTGTDLGGCEVSYLTAVRLLEAVLEKDDDEEDSSKKIEKKAESKRPEDKREQSSEGEKEGEEVSAEDKETVVTLIDQMRRRLVDLRKKLAIQKANARNGKDKTKQPHQRTPSETSPGHTGGVRMAKASSSPGRVPKAGAVQPS